MQKIQQMQTLMSQIQTQLNNTNKDGGNDNNTSGENISDSHLHSATRSLISIIVKSQW